jgi:phosphatidylinositol alpha-1,6-mannosyltransferase
VNFLIVGTDFPPKTGGISTYMKELSTALSKRGQVTVLAPGINNTSSLDYVGDFQIIRTPAIPLLRYLAFLIYFPWLIRRYRIDAVIHTIWLTTLISHLYFHFMPISYFVSVHASEILDDTRTWRRRLKGYLKPWRVCALKKAKGLFPVSHFSAKIVSTYGIEKNRICVISNGVDLQRFKNANSCQRKSKITRLLTVARLDLHKGHDFVLDAIAILKREGLNPHYLIVGEGEEEIHLRKKVKTLGLNQQVKFMGFISDSELPDIYAGSDIFVMASRQIPGRFDLIEGFGISFLEASASGLPVVAGNSGGVSDAVRDGETGLLVNPDSPEDIARALKRLLCDNDLAQQLGKKGRKWVETQMSWDCVAEKMHDSIQRLM